MTRKELFSLQYHLLDPLGYYATVHSRSLTIEININDLIAINDTKNVVSLHDDFMQLLLTLKKVWVMKCSISAVSQLTGWWNWSVGDSCVKLDATASLIRGLIWRALTYTHKLHIHTHIRMHTQAHTRAHSKKKKTSFCVSACSFYEICICMHCCVCAKRLSDAVSHWSQHASPFLRQSLVSSWR